MLQASGLAMLNIIAQLLNVVNMQNILNQLHEFADQRFFGIGEIFTGSNGFFQ